jgi:hypothetical protein
MVTMAQQHAQDALPRFHGNNGYANAPQYYVIRTLYILSKFTKCEVVHVHIQTSRDK